MDALDRIPWHDLQHAYGPADDVPGLLRALRTAPPAHPRDDSPLSSLFGNIWHQGTVYQATAYAVPFLIELAADPATPDRVGILSLLSEIAQGTSYREVHGNVLGEPDFEAKKRQELQWVQQARDAVAAGFTQLARMVREKSELGYAAAHVLAQLPAHRQELTGLLLELLPEEPRAVYRAAVLLMLGTTAHLVPSTLQVLEGSVVSAEEIERHAAAWAWVRLKFRPLTDAARAAIMDAIVDNALDAALEGLPWNAAGTLDRKDLFDALDPPDRDRAIERLTTLIESGNGTGHHGWVLVTRLFRQLPPSSKVRIRIEEMTPQQFRAIQAIHGAMQRGQRVFYSYFPAWGLPDTVREWRELASGRNPAPPDEGLPLLADANHPQRSIAPATLVVGQRIISRYFGHGTVAAIAASGPFTSFTIEFDEEGRKEFSWW